MPTLWHSGRVYVRLFDDDHRPPHIHVWTPDGEIMISLGDLSVFCGTIRTRDYELAMNWIRGNIAFLRQEWTRRNG